MRLRQKGWLWYHAFKFDNNFWLQWTFLSLIYLSCIINIYIFNFLKNLISIPQNSANEVITKLLAIWCLRHNFNNFNRQSSNLKLNRSNSLGNCIPRRLLVFFRTSKLFAESLLAMKFVWCRFAGTSNDVPLFAGSIHEICRRQSVWWVITNNNYYVQSAVKERTGPLAVDVGGMTLYNVGIENKALLLFYDTGIPNCSNR